jgi:DNA-binding MarR family transcriptional regulator
MSRAVTQLYDSCLAPTGLKATQFIILQTIARAGEIAQWELGEQLAISVDTLTRRLGSLRREQLMTMRKGTHKQERIYTLTPLGQERLHAAEPYWERAQARLEATIGNARWQQLLSFSAEVSHAAQRALEIPMANPARAAK